MTDWHLLLDYDRLEDLPGLGWRPVEWVQITPDRREARMDFPPGATLHVRLVDGSTKMYGPAGEGTTHFVLHDVMPATHFRVVGVGGVELPDEVRVAGIIRARLERAGYTVAIWSLERSTNGWHGRAVLDPEPRFPMEVVALQAICGSDPLREACNVQRAREVLDMGAHAAHVLLTEPDRSWWPGGLTLNGRDRALQLSEREAEMVVEGFLAARTARPDAFWISRWNTLYKPRPKEVPTT